MKILGLSQINQNIFVLIMIFITTFSLFSGVLSHTILQINPDPAHIRDGERYWSADKQLGGIPGPDLVREQENVYVVSDNNQFIYVTWQDNRAGDWNIYFTKSANAGALWQDNVSVSNASSSLGNQRNPVLALHPTNNEMLYLVWQDERNDDGDIYFTMSSDRGDTWSTEVQVNPDETLDPKIQWYPTVAADRLGNIFVAWSDNTNGDWEILLSSSSDSGVSWSEPVIVNDPIPTGKDQLKPSIGIDSYNIVYVSWEDNRNGDTQVFLSRSLNHGKTFDDELQVSEKKMLTSTRDAKMIVDDYDNIMIIWVEDYNSRYNVYFTRSINNGISFSKPVQVNNVLDSVDANAEPSVVADNNGIVYIAWSDERSFKHIYSAYSIDNGKTYEVNEQLDDADNTSATGISDTTQEELWRGNVQLTRVQTKLFAFWLDYRNDPNPDDDIPTNSDIYYDWNFTKPNMVPEKPEFLSKNIKKYWNYINLTWKTSQELDFKKYMIYKSTVKDFIPDQSTLNATINDRFQNYHNLTNLDPATTYYFKLKIEDMGGLTNISEKLIVNTNVNIPPTIELNEPDGSLDDLVDNQYLIEWEDGDPDDNATITLYYDENRNPTDGKQLIAKVPQGEDSDNDYFVWDTSMVKNGSYFIIAIISDVVNGESFPVYSSGKLKIYHGDLDPWLTVTFLSPKNDTNVELDSSIVVIFNKKVDLATVHQESFIVTNSTGEKVSGEYSLEPDKTKLVFTPSRQWNGLERYNVTLTKSIKDSTGLFKLYTEVKFWFETMKKPVYMGSIKGEVVDDLFNPILGANVTIVDINDPLNAWSTTTNETGWYIFNLVYGEYNLYVDSESYQRSKTLVINLSKQILDLDEITLIRPEIIVYSIQTTIKLDQKLEVYAEAAHPNNEPLTYLWDFGDGSNQTGNNLSHKYESTGTYDVTLTVIDTAGGYVSITESVNVEPEELGPDYLLMVIGISLLILLIGLVIIYIAVHKAKKRREARVAELERDERVVMHKDEDDDELYEDELEVAEEEEDIEIEDLTEDEFTVDEAEPEDISDTDLESDIDVSQDVTDEELEEQVEPVKETKPETDVETKQEKSVRDKKKRKAVGSGKSKYSEKKVKRKLVNKKKTKHHKKKK